MVIDVCITWSHQASRLAAPMTRSIGDTSMSSNPAVASSSRTSSAEPSENGPGPSGTAEPVSPRAISASRSTFIHGLRSSSSHTASATRPPGLSTRRVSRSAASGSSSSMYPKRQMTASTDAVGRSIHSACMLRSSTFVAPTSSACSRAAATMLSEPSVMSTLPPGATICAASSPVSPSPAASSSTRCPGWGWIASTSHCDTGSIARWKFSRVAVQPPAMVSQWAISSSRSSLI